MAFLAGGTTIGDALIRIGADTRQMRAEMATMNAQVRSEMATTSGVVSKETKKWGGALTAVKFGIMGLGAGLALFAVDAIKTAAEYDRAMAKVYALTGQTGAAMKALDKQVLELATRVPQSPKALAEGLYYVVSAGFSATDALKVLEVAAKDATVGLTDTQTVADGLTSAMNAYGYGADKAAHVSDVLTAAVTAGKMEWGQLASSIGTAAVQGSTAGVKLEEVTSAIATMTRSGLTAQRASMGVATLMRALGNPTAGARKEMKALGLEWDSNTVKSKGLIGSLQAISDAAGKHIDVIVKAKNGAIDWDKTAEATLAANKGWAANLQAMTGNARGFLAAQILLKDGAKDYREILTSSLSASQGVGLTADAFEKMKQADPGLMFDLLRNKVQVMAITFGQTLMPYLSRFVGLLTTVIPDALGTVGNVWNSTVGPAVGEMVRAFAGLFGVLASIFTGKDMTKGGDGFKTLMQGIGSVVAQIARDGAAVAKVLTAVFSNPVAQAAARIAAALLAVNLVLRGGGAIAGGLDSLFRSTMRSMSFGFLFKPQAAAASPANAAGAAMQAGGEKGGAAVASGGQKGGAAIEAGAARAGRLLAGGAEGSALSNYAKTVGGLDYVGTPGLSTRLSGAMAAEQRAAYAASLAAEEQAALSLGARVRGTATKTMGAIRQGISGVGSALSTGLGFVSKAFMPLLVASIGVEFIKAPLGDLIANNTQFKRAGALMKDDFFGGLIGLVTSWAQGSDLSLVLPQIKLGSGAVTSAIDTTTLGGFNLSDAQVAALKGGGLGAANTEAQISPALKASLQQGVKESVTDWYNRIQKDLAAAGLDNPNIKSLLERPVVAVSKGGAIKGGLDPSNEAKAKAAIDAAVNTWGSGVGAAINKDVTDALVSGLGALGFNQTQVELLPTDVKQRLALLLQSNINGAYTDLITWSAKQAITASGVKPIVTAADVLAKQKVSAAKGAEFVDESSRSGRRTSAVTKQQYAAAEALKENLANNVAPAQDAYRRFVADVMADTSGVKQAAYNAGLNFIGMWGTAIEAAKTDKQKAALAKKMGMTYDAAVQLLGESRAASGQNLDLIVKAQWEQAMLQGAKDGSTDAMQQVPAILFSHMDDPKMWGPALAGMKSKAGAALAAAFTNWSADPSSEAAKAAFAKAMGAVFADPKSKDAQALQKAFAAWFPKGSTAGTASGFADAYKAWVSAGMLDPTKPNAFKDTLLDMSNPATNAANATNAVAGAMTNLYNAATPFLRLLGVSIPKSPGETANAGAGYGATGHNAAPNNPTVSPNTSSPSGGATRAAFGGYIAKGGTAWVGEYGPELINAVAGPMKVTSTSKVARLISNLVAAAGHPPARQTTQSLAVEHMYLTGPAERRSVLEQVAFLAPAGV